MDTCGKKAKALKKRKLEETRGGHSKSCLEGDFRDYHEQKITKRLKYIVYPPRVQRTPGSMYLFAFKSAKSKTTRWKDDGTCNDVSLKDVWISLTTSLSETPETCILPEGVTFYPPPASSISLQHTPPLRPVCIASLYFPSFSVFHFLWLALLLVPPPASLPPSLFLSAFLPSLFLYLTSSLH